MFYVPAESLSEGEKAFCVPAESLNEGIKAFCVPAESLSEEKKAFCAPAESLNEGKKAFYVPVESLSEGVKAFCVPLSHSAPLSGFRIHMSNISPAYSRLRTLCPPWAAPLCGGTALLGGLSSIVFCFWGVNKMGSLSRSFLEENPPTRPADMLPSDRGNAMKALKFAYFTTTFLPSMM